MVFWSAQMKEKNTESWWKGLNRVYLEAYNLSWLSAIRKGMLNMAPLILMGSIAVLINNFPLPYYQEFMLRIFGETWKSFGSSVWNASFGIMSMAMVFSISYAYCENHELVKTGKTNPVICALISFAFFMLITQSADGSFAFDHFGATGLFLALIACIISATLFLFLSRLTSRFLFFSDVDQSIPQVVSAIIPGVVVLALGASTKILIYDIFGMDIHTLFYEMLQRPFRDMVNGPATALIFNITSHTFWFFGIHGNNVLEPVSRDVFVAAQTVNTAAYLAGEQVPNILTKPFFDVFVFMGGSGSTLSLIAALFIGSKQRNLRSQAKMAILPGIFNINEILIYGLPIVLNPVFLIPFLSTPVVLSLISYVAVFFGIVPKTIATVDWTSPIILGGYMATGSWTGSALQLLNLAVGTIIYLPFVHVADRQKKLENAHSCNELFTVVEHKADPSVKTLINRRDTVGNLARLLAGDLKTAIATNSELRLEYQPLTERTGRLFGFEALLRWTHPQFGYIPPPVIISIAEESGQIFELGDWVLRTACAERARWNRVGIDKSIIISTNLSTMQLSDSLLLTRIESAIKNTGIDASQIEIEITETLALNLSDGVISCLQGIRDLGVVLSMDDFGMGHSSLLYIKNYPVDIIKIDGTLVSDVVTDRSCRDIISSIVSLCKSMNIICIAEYVETAEQRDVLYDLGVDCFQGFLYSKSLMPEYAMDYIFRH